MGMAWHPCPLHPAHRYHHPDRQDMNLEDIDRIINNLHGLDALTSEVYEPPIPHKFPQYNRPDEGTVFELICSQAVSQHIIRITSKGSYRKPSRHRPIRER